MNVTIRKTPRKNNKSTLSLSITNQGLEKYEGLKIWIYDKPKNQLEKEHNKRTTQIAENRRAQRLLEMQDANFNMVTGFKSQESFFKYFSKLVRERRKNESNYGNWLSAYKHLLAYNKAKDLRFCDCTEAFVKGFREYLLNAPITKSDKQLSNNSAISYFNKLKAALNQAHQDNMISNNPAKKVKGIKQIDTHREYLLEEELKVLIKTPCSYPRLKDAFLFGCLTGLRWSDINKLTWGELEYCGEISHWRIRFRQKKTNALMYHPITEEAYNLLGSAKENSERVFKGLKYSAWNNHLLQEWVWKDAGIKKKITFHISRHSYATLLINKGVRIEVLQDLLGHQDIKTTQIYAKIMNLSKTEAVDLLPKLF